MSVKNNALTRRAIRLLPGGWQWNAFRKISDREQAARYMGMTVGQGCRMISATVASEYHLVTIGNRVTVSSEVLFITHDGAGWLVADERGLRRYRKAPIVVGDNVFIGARSTIMPGVQIGNNVIVAAGSVVAKSVPDGVIVGGIPAKVIGSYDSFIQKATDEWTPHGTVEDAPLAPYMASPELDAPLRS